MEDFKNLSHYELLGVARDASADEVKRAYRQQVAVYHPDHYTHASPPEQQYASERMQRLNEAYDILSDPKKRTIYDLQQPDRPKTRMSDPFEFAQSPQSRDYQAELYNQSREHLNTGRYVQAVATLRELQQINPFYRDSAVLLARARAFVESPESANSSGKVSSHSQSQSASPLSGQSRRIRSLLGGLGALAFLGLLSAFFVIPQFQTRSVSGIESPTTIAPTQVVGVVDETSTSLSPSPLPPSPTSLQVSPTRSTLSSPVPAASNETATVSLEISSLLPAEVDTDADEVETIVVVDETPRPSDEILVASATPLADSSDPLRAFDAEAGDILARYDFTTVGEWAHTQDSSWSVGSSDGTYRIEVQSGIGNIWSFNTTPAGSAYSIGSDVTVTGGVAGLALHFLDNNNYLAFLLDPVSGSYWLEQYHNGQTLILAEGVSPSVIQAQDSTNRLVAHLKEGGTVEVFINNTSVAVRSPDDLIPTNRYGLIASAGDSDTVAWFDNVEVRALP